MGNISVRKAAQQYNIPKSTLIDRVSGHTYIDCVKSGVSPLFTEEQEALLKNHLVTMAEVGYGYSRQETINLASDYAIHLGLRDLDHPLTSRWLQGFLERFPELKVKKPRSLEVARACSATRPTIANYFKELDGIMKKYNLYDKPHSIFNIDEKGLSLEHKPPKIVAGKHYKAQAVTAERSKTVTLIGCVSGVGRRSHHSSFSLVHEWSMSWWKMPLQELLAL